MGQGSNGDSRAERWTTSVDVRARWPRYERFFSTIAFGPCLRIDIAPLVQSFAGGRVALEMHRFDPGRHQPPRDDDAWVTVDQRRVTEAWRIDDTKRLILRPPHALLEAETAYSFRLQLWEQDKVGPDEFATLTLSYFYLDDPIRVQSPSTAIALLALLVAFFSAVVSFVTLLARA